MHVAFLLTAVFVALTGAQVEEDELAASLAANPVTQHTEEDLKPVEDPNELEDVKAAASNPDYSCDFTTALHANVGTTHQILPSM